MNTLTQKSQDELEYEVRLKERLKLLKEELEAGKVKIAEGLQVADMHKSIKGIFGGDLFPAHNENLVSKCGIYTDTIILPNPFLRSKHIFAIQNDSQKVYYNIKI